jgi:hypothetical protein
MINALICPNCGANLPPPSTTTEVITCQYCNTTFRIPNAVTPEPDIGNLVLGADFSQEPIAGWNFPNKDDIRLIHGNPPELRAKFKAASELYYVINSSGYFDDIDASVNIRFYGGNLEYIDAGLMVRYQKSIGSYFVLISAQSTYTVACYEKGEKDELVWKTIMNWTKHSAIRPGLNQTNRLRIIAHDEHLHIYLNGVLATSIHDHRYEEGEVILATEGTAKSSVEVGFTDLQLREVKEN